MMTHQGCPQTPGGRIRALGFASTRTRGHRRGPIPAMCQYQGSPVSDAGRAHPRPLESTHCGLSSARGAGAAEYGLLDRRAPNIGNVIAAA